MMHQKLFKGNDATDVKLMKAWLNLFPKGGIPLSKLMEEIPVQREPYTLYVANIPRDTPKAEIEEIFRGIDGYLDINLFRDRETQQFKGVAFVNYEHLEGAQEAIRKYNKTIQWGSEIVVDYSDKTKERNKELVPAYTLIQIDAQDSKEERMNNITKTLAIVAPIEILIGNLVDKREPKAKIRATVSEKMSPDAFEDIEPLINELTDRAIQRRENGNY